MNRRQIIVGAAATAVIATMPVVATAVEVVDPAAKPMQVLFAQLLAQVRQDGYAVFAGVRFVLDERAGITALRMMALDDNEMRDVVFLERRLRAQRRLRATKGVVTKLTQRRA